MATYTTDIKDEISRNNYDPVGCFAELSGFVRFDGSISKKDIVLTIENASVARRIYKLFKICFDIRPLITVRVQKRFRVKQIYILTVDKNVLDILEKLDIYENGKKKLPGDYFLSTDEDKISFLQGLFLATGSISDPQTSGYHLEFNVSTLKDASYIVKLLNNFKIVSKYIKHSNHYMVYVKSAEMISSILKLFNATESMYYFEDIRIYRDHKNMVNRLNNCELANQEKTIATGLKQLEDIEYIKNNGMLNLLDDRIQEVVHYRELYPETSYSELAEIVSKETGINVTKSGINHYFRKIKALVDKSKKNIE